MKKYFVCLLCLCVMGVSVQAVIIDDFEDGNVDEYTSTVILDNNGGGSNTADWQITTGGELQLNTTVYDGIEQYAMIYDGLTLPIGAELRVDISRTTDSQDIGLYVGGTTPVTGTRQDYIAMYARNDGRVFSRGFEGTSEYGLTGGNSPAYESLFIARTAENTFEAGYYENGVRNITATRNPSFANEADVIGFYADVRATGLDGNADNLAIVTFPYDPSDDQVQDESSGGVDVTLNWSAAADPLSVDAVDSAIVDQYVFVSGADVASDPNLYYVGSTGDPGTTDPASSLTVQDLLNDTDYNWAVVEALDGYAQTLTANNTLADVDPNNTIGFTWSFTTISKEPSVEALSPSYIAVDAADDPNVVLTVTSKAGNLQWYKEGVVDALEDGAKYDGVTTKTLTIIDVDQSDEGYYYCVASKDGFDDVVSDSGRVMIYRLTSYYDFESITTLPDGNDVCLDAVDGYHAVLSQESATAGFPTIVSDANSLPGHGYYLNLVNDETDPNGQFAQLYAGVVDYEDLTISVWVHPGETNGNEWMRILDCGDGGDAEYLFLTPDAGGSPGLRFTMTNSGWGNEQQLNGFWLSADQWYHVAVTLSGDEGRLYRNGQLVDTQTISLNPLDIATSLCYLGKSQFPDAEYNGLIDELEIYNYALSGADIAKKYLNVVQTGYICNPDVAEEDQLMADLNADCQVSLEDFAILAAEWLDNNRIYPD